MMLMMLVISVDELEYNINTRIRFDSEYAGLKMKE